MAPPETEARRSKPTEESEPGRGKRNRGLALAAWPRSVACFGFGLFGGRCWFWNSYTVGGHRGFFFFCKICQKTPLKLVFYQNT